MQHETKKVIAREWLTFLKAFSFGLTVVPAGISLLAGRIEEIWRFYPALFDGRDWVIPWAVALAPYVLYQLVRSIRWARRESQKK